MGVLPKPKPLNEKADSLAILNGKKRVQVLAEEEKRLVKSVNTLREEIVKLQEQIVEAKIENQPRLIVRKSILEKEVETLEARRRDAIKPVNLHLEEIARREAAISKTAQEVLAISDKNKEEARSIEIRKKEVESKETVAVAMLKVAERKTEEVKEAEDELRKQTSIIAEQNAIKVGEMDDVARELNKEKHRLEERNKALDNREAQLNEEKKRLENEDRRIKDGYKNLEAARKEILGK